MNAPNPPVKLRGRSFSLGTLFLIVTCAGVALVGYRFPGGSFWLNSAVSIFLVGAFLAVWFLATRQINRLRFPTFLAACGLVFFAILLPFVAVNRDHSSLYCADTARQIGLALLNYHQAYGSFPPAYVADASGKPLYSWRVLILPYIEESRLVRAFQYDEAWNGPTNAKLASAHLAAFTCPVHWNTTPLLSDWTDYLAVVGPHTAWPGAAPRRLAEFVDPTKTILVVEVADSRVHWAEPRDLDIHRMPMAVNASRGTGISSDHAGGAWAVFADSHVEFLPDSTDPKKLAEMLDIDGQSSTPGQRASP